MRKYDRLKLNFHQTFLPERRYISILLEKIEDSVELSDQELSKLTNIPMGKSSGKLPATLSYAKGMGLLKIKPGPNRKIYLTELGKVIKKEDLFLQEELTQWLLHFQLCKKTNGADLWYHIFNKSFQTFSSTFSIDQLENYLMQPFGNSNKSLIGPALRTYFDSAALSLVDIIYQQSPDKNMFTINTPPLYDSYSYLYGYLFLCLWEETKIKNDLQVTITDFNRETEFFFQLNLNPRQIDNLLLLIESKNVIEIDKQMNPWIIKKKSNATDIIRKIYDLL